MKQAPQVSDGLYKLLVGVLIGALGMAFWFGIGDLIEALVR